MLLEICESNTLLYNVAHNDGKIHYLLSELHMFDQEFHELSHVDSRSEVKNSKVLKLSSFIHRRLNALTANFNLLVFNLLVFAVILIFLILRFRLRLLIFLILLLFNLLLTFSFAG